MRILENNTSLGPENECIGISALLRPLGHTNLSNEFLIEILLYSHKDFTDGLYEDIRLLTPCFIHQSGRFDKEFKI